MPSEMLAEREAISDVTRRHTAFGHYHRSIEIKNRNDFQPGNLYCPIKLFNFPNEEVFPVFVVVQLLSDC